MTIPPCGYGLDGVECTEVGDHMCRPRADHVQKFFEEILLHTKGQYFRRRFALEPWQADEIVRPLFGRVVWSDEFGAYKRQYEVAWIELARKNGKTEILAGIMLYLLVADGEQSAEIYGVARNREQAGLCFEVAAQMVRLQPILAKRLKVVPHKKRIIDLRTASFYQVIAADAAGALGSNPHGVGADEILAWRDGGMWESMRTGMGSGARRQPLMVAATTAGDDSEGFAGTMHAQMEKIQDDPSRSPHTFVYLRNTPKDADPWDEKNWYHANPALGTFLSLEGMRKQAMEAKASPIAEAGFRKLRLNQWRSSTISWMPMHLWDECAGDLFPNAEAARTKFTGRECWIGIDLAARQDLCAVCYLFPAADGTCDLLWRFWIPEAMFWKLNEANDQKLAAWVQNGWLQTTEGDVLDFDRVYQDIEDDAGIFTILGGDADKWSSDPVLQEIGKRTYIDDFMAYDNKYQHMSPGMHRIEEMVREQPRKLRHHGNPVAYWCFDVCEARVAPFDPDLIRPHKPDRQKSIKRIDGVPATIMALNAWTGRGSEHDSVYASSDVMTVNF